MCHQDVLSATKEKEDTEDRDPWPGPGARTLGDTQVSQVQQQLQMLQDGG